MAVDAGAGEPPAIGTAVGDAMVRALRAVPSVLRSEGRQQAILENNEDEAQRMGLPSEAGPVLLQIVNASQAARSDTVEAPVTGRGDPSVREMLMQPFGHITWSFRILTAMSVSMFVIGVAFLIAAMAKALGESDVTTSTLTIAGLGLADFVILFYRRPWQDIARGLSNSQQARIIATSYLSGVAMIESRGGDTHEALRALTRESIELLEEFTEPRTVGRHAD